MVVLFAVKPEKKLRLVPLPGFDVRDFLNRVKNGRSFVRNLKAQMQAVQSAVKIMLLFSLQLFNWKMSQVLIIDT